VDAAIWDAGAVIVAGLMGFGGSGIVVRQARSAQRNAELETERERSERRVAEAARDSAQQRKLDQEAFDRFERHNAEVIKQLTDELRACKEITGAAVGYTQSLHDHMLVVHAKLAENRIAVPPMPRVPDKLTQYPWIPWSNGLTYEDAAGLNGQGNKDGNA
jgi:hypothetical protein